MELHIYDFDGTLFLSPAPREGEVRGEFGGALFDRLSSPVDSNGLGWFQSLATLSPPAVPERPDVETWYIAPVVEHLRAMASSGGEGGGGARCFVLTGRDEKYRDRIESLLAHAGLSPCLTGVFLKPHETAGTVKYKLATIFELVRRYAPRRVYYYEDRPEQGGKIFAGVQQLQDALYPSASPSECSATLAHLPMPASPALSSSQQPLTFSGLFDGRQSREESAVRAARRWVAETVDTHNARSSAGDGGDGSFTNPPPRPRYGGDGIAIAPVTFEAPPPFHFTMRMVPPELSAMSEEVLSAEEQSALIRVLQAERAAYEAGNDPYAAYRGQPYRGRGRGGGWRGGGRGYGHRGRGGGHRRADNSAHEKKWTPLHDYPSLSSV